MEKHKKSILLLSFIIVLFFALFLILNYSIFSARDGVLADDSSSFPCNTAPGCWDELENAHTIDMRCCSGGYCYECDEGLIWDTDNDECTVNSCTPDHHSLCDGNKLYSYDSCGNRETDFEDCGTSDWVGATYCEDNNVHGDYAERSCSTDSCSETIENREKEQCANGCLDGACIMPDCTPEASKDCFDNKVYWYDSCGNRKDTYEEACGENEYIGENFCCGNDVCKKHVDKTCSNGACLNISEDKVQDYCGSGTCLNGICIPATNNSCSLPWGGNIDSGSSVTAYAFSSVPCGSNCTFQARTCNDGSLSGSYINRNCYVEDCCTENCFTGPGCRTSLNNGQITSGSCCGSESCYKCKSDFIWDGNSCEPDCISQASSKCYDHDVYYYDSCNHKENKEEECGTSGYTGSKYCCDGFLNDLCQDYENKDCSGGACTNNTEKKVVEDCGEDEHDEGFCSNGNVYSATRWHFCKAGACDTSFTSSLVEDCGGNGCTNGVCDQPSCDSHDHLACYGGDSYWYDDCGNREDKRLDCDPYDGCKTFNGKCYARSTIDRINWCERKYSTGNCSGSYTGPYCYYTNTCSGVSLVGGCTNICTGKTGSALIFLQTIGVCDTSSTYVSNLRCTHPTITNYY